MFFGMLRGLRKKYNIPDVNWLMKCSLFDCVCRFWQYCPLLLPYLHACPSDPPWDAWFSSLQTEVWHRLVQVLWAGPLQDHSLCLLKMLNVCLNVCHCICKVLSGIWYCVNFIAWSFQCVSYSYTFQCKYLRFIDGCFDFNFSCDNTNNWDIVMAD